MKIKGSHPFKIYDVSEIQKVYRQHHDFCGTVLYSEDGGYIWQSVGMDSGKWNINDWLFTFIGISKNALKIKFINEEIERIDEMIELHKENPSKFMLEQYQHRKEKMEEELKKWERD